MIERKAIVAGRKGLFGYQMQNIIQFPRAMPAGPGQTSDTRNGVQPRPGASPVQAIRTAIDTLSHTLDQVRAICTEIPEGPARAQLVAERTKLVVALFSARLSAARLPDLPAADANPPVAHP